MLQSLTRYRLLQHRHRRRQHTTMPPTAAMLAAYLDYLPHDQGLKVSTLEFHLGSITALTRLMLTWGRIPSPRSRCSPARRSPHALVLLRWTRVRNRGWAGCAAAADGGACDGRCDRGQHPGSRIAAFGLHQGYDYSDGSGPRGGVRRSRRAARPVRTTRPRRESLSVP